MLGGAEVGRMEGEEDGGVMLGGISLYITGVTMRDKIVELIKPPMSTKASGEMSGLVLNAMGSKPPIAVSEVNTTGRNLVSPACSMAC